MVTLKYPNGYFCTYKAVYCTEGYRYGCEKCLRSSPSFKQKENKDWSRDMWESRTPVGFNLTGKFAGLFSAKAA